MGLELLKLEGDAIDVTFHSTRYPCHFRVNPAQNTAIINQLEESYSKQTTMSRSTDPGHFFQTDASESTRARRAAKSGNKNGNPIVLQSKILNVIPSPLSSACIYIAESAGCVRKVNVEVGTITVERVWKMGC
jgi:hypothetical protein